MKEHGLKKDVYVSSPAEFVLQNSSEGGVNGYAKVPLVAVAMPPATPVVPVNMDIKVSH